MRYFGDEYFSEFLEMLGFPRILPEIKAIIVRNLWRVRSQAMSVVLKELYPEKDFSFLRARTAEVFFDNISSLWFQLGTHQAQGNYFRFSKFPKARDKKGLRARINTRNLEIKALMPLLTDDAKTIPTEYVNEFHHVAAPIIPATDQIKIILSSTIGSFGEDQIAEWERELDSLDGVLEEAFNHLGWLWVKVWQENQNPDLDSINGP